MGRAWAWASVMQGLSGIGPGLGPEAGVRAGAGAGAGSVCGLGAMVMQRGGQSIWASGERAAPGARKGLWAR